MPPATLDLIDSRAAVQGDPYEFSFTVAGDHFATTDFTDADFTFEAALAVKYGAASTRVLFSCAKEDAAVGSVTVVCTLTAAQTAALTRRSYVWDVQLMDANPTPDEPLTLMRGRLAVLPEVTV